MSLTVVLADGAGFGGAQVYARSLVTHAPAHLRCDVVTTAEPAPHLQSAVEARGGRLHVVRTSVRQDTAPQLQAVLERLAPELVQLNLVDPTSLLAAMEAALAVAPTVATLHMSGPVPAPLQDRTLRAYAGLRALVAVSRDFAALATGALQVPAQRVTHVLNGVDPLDPVTPPGRPVPVVGALGRLTAQKGFDVLLEAVRRLVDGGVALELLLGGQGRDAEALARQADGLPVRFAGFQPTPRPFLCQLDVFCVPSRVEALPLVLLEACSAGLPAVATDVGDVRLALGDVVSVVPPEDPQALAEALAALLADPAARLSRGAAGAARVRSGLTAQRMAEQAWAAFLPAALRPGPG